MRVEQGRNYYSLDEVAVMLGVNKVTVTKYMKERGIRPRIFSRVHHLTEDAIRKLTLPVEKESTKKA